MTKKEFRAAFKERLVAEGTKKPNKEKIKKSISRTARYIRSNEGGDLVWSRRYLKNAVNFY